MQKVALITGITGQDGAYLAEYLLNKNYKVVGLKRRSSLFNTGRIDHLFKINRDEPTNFIYTYFDLSDSTNIVRIIQEIQPDEIYNLAAQSHVKVSFDLPEYTANSDGLGALRILEAIRLLGLKNKTKIYQASTSELFGKAYQIPQNENTPFYPRSPYGVAKLFAYWITVNYREAYGIFASNGILFNHESPLRGETFVTRKITRAAANIALGYQRKLFLGNLNSVRDWGHAKDYVRAMWMILQHEEPDDFVIATGEAHSVREFCQKSFEFLGLHVVFEGSGINERGIISRIDHDIFTEKVGFKPDHLKTGDVIIEVDPFYFRPTEVDFLLGDSSKAKQKLGWSPTYNFEMLVNEMMESDLYLMRKNHFLRKGGFKVLPNIEDVL